MAKKRKYTRSKVSKTRKKNLLKSHTGSQDQRLYSITPSNVAKVDVDWMVNLINRRLRAIEKAGLTEESAEYRLIKHYAISEASGKGKMYNVNMDKGSIRVSKDFRHMTPEERAQAVTVMRNIINAKTSTVKGTKAALQKAYTSAMAAAPEAAAAGMTEEQYVEVWRAYRRNVSKDENGKRAGSDIVMKLIQKHNFYELDSEQLDRAFSYWEQYTDPADWADDLLTAPDERDVTSPFTGENLTLYEN